MERKAYFKPWDLGYWSTAWAAAPLRDKRWFAGLLALHLLLSVWFTTQQSPNIDESDYFGYALRWAKGHPERIYPLDDSKTPLTFPALLPLVAKPFTHLPDDTEVWLLSGRYCMYVYMVLLAFVAFCWLYRLAGAGKWILPWLLLLYDPLLFSYSMVVGSDLPSAAVLLALMYACWRYSRTRHMRYWWLMSVLAGAGLCLKTTFVFMVALLPVLLWIAGPVLQGRQRYRRVALRWTSLLLVLLLVINSVYLFRHTGMPLRSIPFKSELFTKLQQSGFVADIPLPLPADYISGFDRLLHNAAKGGGPAYEQTYPGVNILGRYFANGPVWYYYLAGFVLKMPLLVIALMITAVVMLVKRDAGWQLLKRHVHIWLPAAVFFVLLSVTNPFQIGIRHIMPVLPFVYVAIAPPAVWLWQVRRSLALAMLLLHMLSVGRYGASMLAYTNELVWKKEQVYRYLCDSSVSYGTGKKRAARFLQNNHSYRYLPYAPVAGNIIIPVDALTGQRTAGANNATWLLAFEPVGHYGYDHLLYKVREEDLKRVGYR